MRKKNFIPALIIIVSLLATTACNNKVESGPVTNETSVVQGENDALRRDAEVYAVVPDLSVHFPQLKTRSAVYMLALLVGELRLDDDGYLRVRDTLIIWQPDYFVHNNDGVIEIQDREGKVVGRVGEEIYMGGGHTGPVETIDNSQLTEPLPSDIKGPIWLQGGETRLNLNFSSDLFVLQVIDFGEHKVYSLTKKPALDALATQEVTLTGKLAASRNSVILQTPLVEANTAEYGGGASFTTFWPPSYIARIRNGVFELVDGSGNVVLRDGEEAEIRGRVIYGYSKQLQNELPNGYSEPYLIVDRVLGKQK